MKRLLAVLLLCGSFAGLARADDTPSPEALSTAKDLAAIMTGDTIKRLGEALVAQMWPNIENQFSGKVDAATLADVRAEFESSLASFTADVMRDAPAIYAHYFSAQELRDLIAFYKSPVGTKSLQVLPQITADVTGKMMPRLQAFQTSLSGRIDSVMEKHGYKK